MKKRTLPKSVREEEFKKSDFIVLKAFIGCVLAILTILTGYYIYDLIFNYETIVHVEKYVSDGLFKEFPYDSEVICEEGILLEKYKGLNKKIVYGCIGLENGRCKGYGKICLVKTRERIRK